MAWLLLHLTRLLVSGSQLLILGSPRVYNNLKSVITVTRHSRDRITQSFLPSMTIEVAWPHGLAYRYVTERSERDLLLEDSKLPVCTR